MSRNDSTMEWDGDDVLLYGRHRSAVARSIRGKRGQAFLRELLAALDAMPVKELVDQELQADGRYCALGVVGAARGLTLSEIDPEDQKRVAELMGIAYALATEITWVNDMQTVDVEIVPLLGPPESHHCGHPMVYADVENLPAKRWHTVRDWVAGHLQVEAAT